MLKSLLFVMGGTLVMGFAPPLPQRRDTAWLMSDGCLNPILRPRSSSFILRGSGGGGSGGSISTHLMERSDTIAFISQHAELFSPMEVSIFSRMDEWYSKSLSIKCPFFRRRLADLLDVVDVTMRFVLARHKSLDLIPPPGCRGTKTTSHKITGLSIEDVLTALRHDWREESHKGYYITGRLNTTIYRNDCLFDGPDPDMPVKGLRKYLNAASQLFDYKTSYCELLSLDVVDESTILAKWRMSGVLRLPWHPVLPPMSGTTTYYLDEDGLIYSHEETWDMSTTKAFLNTLLPDVAKFLWPDERGYASVN